MGFEEDFAPLRNEMYDLDGIPATFYPQPGSNPKKKDITILHDDQEGNNTNTFDNTAESGEIWIRQSELVIVRTSNKNDPVPEYEKIVFFDRTWILKEILKTTKTEWKLLVEKERG